MNLLQQRFSLGLGCRVRLRVRTRSYLDQDVPRARLLRHRILRLMRGVILLDLLLRGLRNSSGHIAACKREVGDRALFRHSRRIACRVLLEERFQIGIRRIDLLAQIVRGNHRIVELDLDVVLAVGVPHFLIADRHPGGNQRFQPPDCDVLLHAVFKVGNCNVEPALNECGIFVLADELAARKQHLPRRPCLEIGAHIRIGHVNAQLIRRVKQHLLLHQLLAHLRLDHVHDHRIAGVLWILLLHPLRRQLGHFLLADHLAARQELAVPVRIDHRKRVGARRALACEPGNEIDHHRHGGRCDDDDK